MFYAELMLYISHIYTSICIFTYMDTYIIVLKHTYV